MKKFLLNFFLFSLLVGTILLSLIIGLPLPENYGHNFNCAYSFLDKDSLLKSTTGPRLIFLGGSNLFMGLNSKRIEDTFRINTINASLVGHVGMKFILANMKKYVLEGDKIVLSMEYLQFYGGQSNGGIELLSLITDVSHEQIKHLDLAQYKLIIESVPQLIKLKFWGIIKENNPSKHHNEPSIIHVYDRRAFNKYGDEFLHWNFPKEQFLADAQTLGQPYDNAAMDQIINFKEFVHKKKAELFITFPCFQDLSFDRGKKPD